MIKELNTALDREQIERALADGALETARKDFSRAVREVMALAAQPGHAQAPRQPRAANAA